MKGTFMQACDFETAITRAANLMDLDEEDGSYEMNEKSEIIIDVLAALYAPEARNAIMSALAEAAKVLVDDSRTNFTQEQDEAAQRAEELQFNPPKNDD
jgi:hypothetical protein